MIRRWRGQSKQRLSQQMGGPPAAPEKAFADFLQYRRLCGLIDPNVKLQMSDLQTTS